MYKKQEYTQLTFEDFDQPMGLTMSPDNRWIKKVDLIPWTQLEDEYANLFTSHEGNVAKPFRMALGSLLIQLEFGYSDEETVSQIQENPYLQFFVGLPGYQSKKPFDSSTMVHFRKRLSEEKLMVINEQLLAYHEKEMPQETDSDDDSKPNQGTLMLDATCEPSEIKYAQDTGLLNDARLHTEVIIDEIVQKNKV